MPLAPPAWTISVRPPPTASATSWPTRRCGRAPARRRRRSVHVERDHGRRRCHLLPRPPLRAWRGSGDWRDCFKTSFRSAHFDGTPTLGRCACSLGSTRANERVQTSRSIFDDPDEDELEDEEQERPARGPRSDAVRSWRRGTPLHRALHRLRRALLRRRALQGDAASRGSPCRRRRAVAAVPRPPVRAWRPTLRLGRPARSRADDPRAARITRHRSGDAFASAEPAFPDVSAARAPGADRGCGPSTAETGSPVAIQGAGPTRQEC